MLSILIPAFNEQDNILPLHQRLDLVLGTLDEPVEIILINDGSRDGTAQVMDALAERDGRVKVVHFRRNCGQTAALMAGFDYSRGNVVIAMDGDGQNDPADIPKLLEKMQEGFDVVSGWRQDRQDQPFRKNLMSRLANALISRISGVRLRDYGCTLKAYRRDVLQNLRLYGEMHRFIPIYATWVGARVAEVPVGHSRRQSGRSKYGYERVLKVLLDLCVVQFLTRYAAKPMYVFGGFGLLCLMCSGLSVAWALYLGLFGGLTAQAVAMSPIPLVALLTFMTGILSILMGLLAEMLVRVYHEAQGKPAYLVGRTVNFDSGGAWIEVPTGSTRGLPSKSVRQAITSARSD